MANRLFELCPPGKHSWPELVGYIGEHAAAVIENENPTVTAVIIYENPLTPGGAIFHCSRVKVIVDDHGIVVRTPIIG